MASPENVSGGREEHADDQDRREILSRLEDWLEGPMVLLGVLWLALFVLDLVHGLPPLLQTLTYAIWLVFIADFLVKFALAPEKAKYIRSEWLTIIALAIPALRIFRVARAFRALRAVRASRSIQVVRFFGSTNRAMAAVGKFFGRRGFGYVLGLTLLMIAAGAAGIYAFEKDVPGPGGIHDFGTAVWWTAMVVTTMGSDYFPKTPEGRLICFVLAVYAFAVFGYVTATVATFFVARDAESSDTEIAGAKDIAEIKKEIRQLRHELREQVKMQRNTSSSQNDANANEDSAA
jgi:voltage-gated potassium channel